MVKLFQTTIENQVTTIWDLKKCQGGKLGRLVLGSNPINDVVENRHASWHHNS